MLTGSALYRDSVVAVMEPGREAGLPLVRLGPRVCPSDARGPIGFPRPTLDFFGQIWWHWGSSAAFANMNLTLSKNIFLEV